MNPRTLTSSGTALHFNESKQYGWRPGETRECNCGRNYGAPHWVRKVTWYNHRRNMPILHDRAYIQDDDEPGIDDVPTLDDDLPTLDNAHTLDDVPTLDDEADRKSVV